MWICPECFIENSANNESCSKCHTIKQDTDPKVRREHRRADVLKDKKTMYTHPGPFGWKLSKHGAVSGTTDTAKHITSCRDDYKVVAALDLGTTYSGFAFSTRQNPLDIQHVEKVPTCLLLSPNKEFVGFGNDAIRLYNELVKTGQHTGHYFLQKFKMDLYENEHISTEMTIQDMAGKPIEALIVFRETILVLKKSLVYFIKCKGLDVKMEDIRWVMPVPTFWNDAAKQFLRKSIDFIGIPEDQFQIALEPEAASIFCQQLLPDFSASLTGTRYLIVALGGGTTDITAHEKISSSRLRELIFATGNSYGGSTVDDRFLQMFTAIVGQDIISDIKQNYPMAYIDIFQGFELVKRNITTTNSQKVKVSIPLSVLDFKCKQVLGKDFRSAIGASKFSSAIELYDSTIHVDVGLMKAFFNVTINSILDLIKTRLQEPAVSDVSQILLVGEFAESSLMQDKVKSEFPDKRVIVPEAAGLTVLKGAVLFGHNPSYVQSRVMRYTYGVGISDEFDPAIHDEAHLVVQKNGPKLAKHIFDVIIRKNQLVDAGTSIDSEYLTIDPNQKTMEFELYFSSNEKPVYIDETDCKPLGSVIIHFPDVCQEERDVKVSFVIGNTELEVKAVDKKSRQTVTAEFNLF
ncbi:heat shock 70 kDa protein 12A-like [Mytilus trossulus]|uniref:heat shock 70 kDa protein 12A-like n=1 Tax=Mytilus trossulus TaxID=6551 RepID=UPI003004541D